MFAQDVEREFEAVRGGPARCPTRKLRASKRSSSRRPTKRLRSDDVDFRSRSPTTGVRQLGATSTCIRTRCRSTRSSRCRARNRYSARRRDVRSDGCGSRARRPLQLRRAARLARAELIFTDVAQSELLSLWQQLRAWASPRRTSACSRTSSAARGYFCSLANAKSIPIAEATRAARRPRLPSRHRRARSHISGLHERVRPPYVGHIGVLGVDKNGSSGTSDDRRYAG